MESEANKPLVIDFFGPPGSGKTTISHLLGQKLTEKGYRVDESIYHINSKISHAMRKVIKLGTASLYTFREYAFVREFFGNLDKNTFHNWHEAVTHWLNFCFVLHFLTRKSSHDILIAEQGLAQGIVWLANRGNGNVQELFEKLEKKVGTPIIYVRVQVSEEEILARLQQRNDGKSEVERARDAIQKVALLKEMNNACDKIKQTKHYVTFDNTFKSDAVDTVPSTVDEQLNEFLTLEIQKALKLDSAVY